jgi:seryl-tRNA synthetase
VEEGKSAANQKSYKTKHQAEYQLHDSLKKQLQELGVTKIPSSTRQQQKIDTLEKNLSSSKDELQDLKKQQQKLNIVRENFEHLLLSSSAPAKEQEKDLAKTPEASL